MDNHWANFIHLYHSPEPWPTQCSIFLSLASQDPRKLSRFLLFLMSASAKVKLIYLALQLDQSKNGPRDKATFTTSAHLSMDLLLWNLHLLVFVALDLWWLKHYFIVFYLDFLAVIDDHSCLSPMTTLLRLKQVLTMSPVQHCTNCEGCNKLWDLLGGVLQLVPFPNIWKLPGYF